jgi:hypothetical protein
MAHESLAWLYGDPMGPDGLVAGMYDVVPAQLGTVVGRAKSRQSAGPLHAGRDPSSQQQAPEVSPIVGVILGLFAALGSD